MKMKRQYTGMRLISLCIILVLSACGDGNDGTVTVFPTEIIVGQVLSDIVGRSEFNPYVASVTPGALYKISITGLIDDADLLVYGADSTFSVALLCAVPDNSSIPGASNEDCIIASPGNSLFFAVDGAFLSASAAAYTISIQSVPIINLSLSIPRTDVITRTGAAAYSVPAVPGALHTIGITGLTDDADLHVFGNDGSFSAAVACSIDNTLFTGTTPEDCTLFSSGGTLFFIVDGLFSSAATVQYVAFATPSPAVSFPADEGAIGSPIFLSQGTPTTGQVGFRPVDLLTGESFYAATGLTAGVRYTVSITGLSGDADLTVYGNDSTFTTPEFCLTGSNTPFAGTTPESCTVLLAAGDTLHFSVTSNTISGGVAFINLVSPGP